MARLTDKVSLITGAASGMGRIACQLFASEGSRIVACDVDRKGLDETAQLIADAGGEAKALVMDVTDEEQVSRTVQTAVDTWGGLHVLYNNAGIFPDDDVSVVDLDTKVWDRVLDVNLKGTYLCCKYAVPAIAASGGGSVINIASFVAFVGCSVPQDAYTASKGGVIALTKSLAVQFGPQAVRANAICPGPIETPLLTELLKDPEKRALRLNRIPLGRMGRSEDIVYLALYLGSDESSWTTGGVFMVDGGITSNYF